MQTNEIKSWEELYVAAVLETDPARIADRLDTAQDALVHKMRETPLDRFFHVWKRRMDQLPNVVQDRLRKVCRSADIRV